MKKRNKGKGKYINADPSVLKKHKKRETTSQQKIWISENLDIRKSGHPLIYYNDNTISVIKKLSEQYTLLNYSR